jgi:hypothetical protein
MVRGSQGAAGWPTILWIAWRAGDVDRVEPLCRGHRQHVFEQYPASAHGLGRSGDWCSMCRGQEPRTAPFPGPRTTASRGRPSVTRCERGRPPGPSW